MANPSITQLKRAVEISEKIEALQSELDSILGGSGSAGSAPKKRGRKPGWKATVQAVSDVLAAAPKKRGRGPGKKAGKKAAAKAASDLTAEPVKAGAKKKRVMSPEAKAKIAEAQRKRWAKQKKAI